MYVLELASYLSPLTVLLIEIVNRALCQLNSYYVTDPITLYIIVLHSFLSFAIFNFIISFSGTCFSFIWDYMYNCKHMHTSIECDSYNSRESDISKITCYTVTTEYI